MQNSLPNEVKRKRIINQYKTFYTLYYEAVERQSTKNASAQNRVGSVANVTLNLKEALVSQSK